MGLKTFEEVGNVGFSKSWQDENRDLMLEFKAGEVREIRFIDLFLPMALHWVPFVKKQSGKISFFPQMCLKWDLEASALSETLECPACDHGVGFGESGIFWVIDVEALYLGDKSRALKIFEVGSRERRKLGGLSKFNKVKGTPYPIGHSKYGRIVQVSYDPNNSDKSLRWQFSKGERLPVKLLNEGSMLKVKIPDSADSDYAGKVYSFELRDLLEIVVPPALEETKQKFQRMQVADALKRLNKDNETEDDYEDTDDDDSSSRSSRRGSGRRRSPRSRSRDEEDRPRNRRRRASRNEEDENFDDDFDDDTDPEEEEPKPRGRRRERDTSRSRRRESNRREEEDENFDDDDDDFDDDDDKPKRSGRRSGSRDSGRRSRPNRRRQRSTEEDEDDDDRGTPCNKKATRGKKCPLHKRCFGHIGDEETETEDCTICVHKDECLELNTEDDDDE